MPETHSLQHPPVDTRKLLSKVPEVTVYFWIIKVLCTTVGETFADFLNGKLGDNLNRTTIVMGSLLVIALIVQFRVRGYIPAVYWVAVVLLSVVGTLITDNMVENHGITLTTSSIVFGVLMLATFGIWQVSEKTLSIHSIHTAKREAFYWTAILFTFALGTATGDLIAEKYNLGYGKSVALFAGLIALITLAHYKFRLNAILAFWMAYVLTRPLGASIGDLMSQPRQIAEDADPGTGKGFGLGTTGTSIVFLSLILIVVVIMTQQQRRKPVLIDEAAPVGQLG
ncbi:MAG: rane protein [Ilumatobacteraceae bacterium]|nr:rane protein [Ilumatobacteraceae bacterium]MCU1390176.1 rane protein [Ilumatobacteraceae bacterium]